MKNYKQNLDDYAEKYLQGEKIWDNAIDENANVRERFEPLYDTVNSMSDEEISQRAGSLSKLYLNQGVTFDFDGVESPFPLDFIPRIITAKEWKTIEAGVKQRIRALEAFLDDLYGDQNIIKEGIIPAYIPLSSPDLKHPAFKIKPANGVRLLVSGIDLVRDPADGNFKVLEDNIRIPSGVSYVLSNRQAMLQSFGKLFNNYKIASIDNYPKMLLSALIKAAPKGTADPTVVVLTPGSYNSAYFEHSLLSRLMGVQLVEGRDLFCKNSYVYMRTTSGPKRVDVIYRRVDDEWIDPVQFKQDSMLGVPGLVGAAVEGNVTLANAIGNGVADDKLTYTYVPDFIKFYLGEEPILSNVKTWRLGNPDELAEIIDRLHEVVVKPVNGSGGKGVVIGPNATSSQLVELRAEILKNPRNFIAQPVVRLSTSPTYVKNNSAENHSAVKNSAENYSADADFLHPTAGDSTNPSSSSNANSDFSPTISINQSPNNLQGSGTFSPRHVDLRPFAINSGGGDIFVLPGGLTRVALTQGELIVNSSQGGGSKDTWVTMEDDNA
jgi:uncharacterized circularly permuted ATP-grasp superfamily protein